eukprot:Selendium_serpulae@DN8248_c0_g1_i1.p1
MHPWVECPIIHVVFLVLFLFFSYIFVPLRWTISHSVKQLIMLSDWRSMSCQLIRVAGRVYIYSDQVPYSLYFHAQLWHNGWLCAMGSMASLKFIFVHFKCFDFLVFWLF